MGCVLYSYSSLFPACSWSLPFYSSPPSSCGCPMLFLEPCVPTALSSSHLIWCPISMFSNKATPSLFLKHLILRAFDCSCISLRPSTGELSVKSPSHNGTNDSDLGWHVQVSPLNVFLKALVALARYCTRLQFLSFPFTSTLSFPIACRSPFPHQFNLSQYLLLPFL